MQHHRQTQNWPTFTNSTGQHIPTILTNIRHPLPGHSYPSAAGTRKQDHSLWVYIYKLIRSIVGVQLRTLLGDLRLSRRVKTLHSEFSDSSLVILFHSVDLEEAVCKAQEYNIPLLQVVIRTSEGKMVIRDKVLTNFAVAHLINQNYVFYGDEEHRPELVECLGMRKGDNSDLIEGMYFRKGELVYGFIPMHKLAMADQLIIQENLLHIRNAFYSLQHQQNMRRQRQEDNQQPVSEISSILQPSASYFGAMALDQQERQLRREQAEEMEDNFNDSDNQAQVR